MARILQQLRYAIRILKGHPGTTLVAVGTLALGIGSITPTFSLISAYLLRPLPFAEADRLVHLWSTDIKRGWDQGRVSLPDLRDWEAQSRSFEAMAAFNYTSVDLTGGEMPETISAGDMSANAFDVLGVQPALGRVFLEGEDQPGRNDVVVLSDRLWRGRFAADPDILGRSLEIFGAKHTIVGVMPPEFVFPIPTTELWLPYAFDSEATPRGHTWLQVVGRLAPGASAAEAQAEMTEIAARLERQYPDSNEARGVRIESLRGALNFAHEIFQMLAVVLLTANILVLLIACANVSSLLLAKSLSRRREIAIRSALGASRASLMGLFLTESAVLSVVGGGFGVLLSAWALDSIDRAIPPDIYRVGGMELDLPMLLFTLGISLGAALLSGLLPAWRASRTDPGESLKEGSHATAPRRVLRLQGALVTSQVALASLLLVGTSLMIRSFLSLQDVDPGFDTSGVLTLQVNLPERRYDDPAKVAAFHEAVVREVNNAPGIQAASTVNFLPLNHESGSVTFLPPGAVAGSGEAEAVALSHYVSPGYFDVLGIPRVSGRMLEERDRMGVPRVAVINELLAERHWPGADPVGRTLSIDGLDEPVTIIGVVKATRHLDLAGTPQGQVYFSQTQRPWRYHRIVARVNGDPLAAAATVREAIWRVDRLLPINSVRSLDEVIAEFLLPQSAASTSLVMLGAGALLLGVVGIYGLISFMVSHRRTEIALRVALGAGPAEVYRLVMGRGVRLAVAGLLVGLAGGVALSMVMSNFFFGVSPADPVAFLAVPLLVLGATLASCYGPARRASRSDPAIVLRYE